jgi:hypothetical protein
MNDVRIAACCLTGGQGHLADTIRHRTTSSDREGDAVPSASDAGHEG